MSMSMAHITTAHHERLAYVYVRQSTLWQVNEHQESTERQYRLQERALQLGWPPTAIAVIDEDQGRSGSSATARTGFRRLVSEVSLGQVGMVLMLEASRMARKGLLQYPLPVGYVRAPDGTWDLDPDQQVRERLAYLFEAFRRLGVARQVVRELKHHGLDLPTRVVSKGAYGILVWKRPTLSAVVRILENPAYAGAYTYGRWEYRGDARSPKTGKARARLRPRAQWPVLLLEHHPAYVSWEEYMQTQERLRQNWQRDGSRGVARQGAALLQGIVWCGHCG